MVRAAVAAQLWWAPAGTSASRDTVELERTLFGEIQSQHRSLSFAAPACRERRPTASPHFPDLGRTPVTARIDPNSGNVTWELVAPAVRELR